MLRAAVLLSLLGRILRFSTTGHPGALGACYVASWQLPRLDSHQLADDSLSGHTSELLGGARRSLTQTKQDICQFTRCRDHRIMRRG
jgi:hypothetical protein